MKSIVFLAILSVSALAYAETTTTINRIGNSCQICKVSDSFSVCKYYKLCPIPKKKKGE